MFESTAKLSTSKNAKLMSLEEARRDAYVQETAKQLRLQMSAYMLSFLTNTILSLVGDSKFASNLPVLVMSRPSLTDCL
jgi:hypothetical protein